MAASDRESRADKERLAKLEARIDALKAERAPKPSPKSDAVGGAELAWRMVIELVAGIGIGFGIGYGLDTLLGTIPWLLIFFTLLGFAAGVQTMMRSARAAQAAQAAREAAERATLEDEGDDARGD
ncbi:MAG: AtpZ/AtpI family protein [Pseudomonadota bacterium]